MRTSQEIDKLADALAQAQLEMPPAELDKRNPHFNSEYASFSSIVKASRIVGKHGIAISQGTLLGPNGERTLVTMLMHKSGQWIASDWPLDPVQKTPQGMGSALTYGKRYMQATILNMPTGEDDDDGHEASAKSTADKPAAAPAKAAQAAAPTQAQDAQSGDPYMRQPPQRKFVAAENEKQFLANYLLKNRGITDENQRAEIFSQVAKAALNKPMREIPAIVDGVMKEFANEP